MALVFAITTLDFISSHRTIVILASLAFTVIIWISSSIKAADKLREFPWVGVHSQEWFAESRAFLRGFKHGQLFISQGYKKYSKKGKMFISLDTAGRPQVFLSPSHLEEALKIDGKILDEHSFFPNFIAEKYTFGGYGVPISINGQHVVCIRGLTRALPKLSPMLQAETVESLRKYWGTDSSWREIKVVKGCKSLTGQITTRMLVGLPLCRNDAYLELSMSWIETLLLSGALINMLPAILQPVFAPLLMIPTNRLTNKSLKYLVPIASQRLIDRARQVSDPDFQWDEPLDYLKFLLDEPSGFNGVMSKSPVTLARGAMMINAAAFFASAYALANVLLDIYSCPLSMQVVEQLREECERVDREEGLGTKIGIAKLIRLDSAVREGMRLGILDATAMHRYVKPKEGYTFSGGEFLPQAAHLCFPAGPYQQDEELYENPRCFDPFRYSRPLEEDTVKREEGAKRVKTGEPNGASLLEAEMGIKAPTTAVSTGSTYFPWGVGKSQCPGRFFAVHEIKVVLAEIIMNYDVKLLAERPKNIPTGTFSMPSETAKLMVRRRVQD